MSEIFIGFIQTGYKVESLYAGIILGKQEHSIGDQMRGLLRLASIKSAEEMINNVEFLGRWL